MIQRPFQEMSESDLSPTPSPSPSPPPPPPPQSRRQLPNPRPRPNWHSNSLNPRFPNRASSISHSGTIAPSAPNRRRASNSRSPSPLSAIPPRARSGPSAAMSGNARPRPRAVNHEHVIDLTEDLDEPEGASSPQRNRINGGRARRPPQFERRDASLLDNAANVVDLTDDMEPEVMITGERRLPAVRRGNQHGHGRGHIHRRQESPSLFLPPEPEAPNHPFARAFHHPLQAVRAVFGFMDRPGNPHEAVHAQQAAQNFYQEIQRIGIHGMAEPFQNMPNMDYANAAIRNRKPDHNPPPPAREGFTRSPQEDDVIVCPSCDEELVDIKNVKEPVVKKGGRAPTKKDQEEHPFWAVQNCGHVCFSPRISKFSTN